jgi:hypothetical protein
MCGYEALHREWDLNKFTSYKNEMAPDLHTLRSRAEKLALQKRIAELEASVEAEIEARAQAQMAEAHYACELSKARAERDEARALVRHMNSVDGGREIYLSLKACAEAVKRWEGEK